MPEKKEQKTRQLDLSLKYSKIEGLYKLKRFATNVEKRFTALPFWRNGYIWLNIFSVFFASLMSLLLIINKYSKLPQDIPLTYDTIEERWNLAPRLFLFLVPVVFIVLGILNIQILRKTYYMNKKLTLMICFCMAISFLLALTAVNEILVLSTT